MCNRFKWQLSPSGHIFRFLTCKSNIYTLFDTLCGAWNCTAKLTVLWCIYIPDIIYISCVVDTWQNLSRQGLPKWKGLPDHFQNLQWQISFEFDVDWNLDLDHEAKIQYQVQGEQVQLSQ